MFGISGTELFIIVVFVLLIFGPDKLPQFGRTIGQMMREFKRAQETMESVIRAEVYADKKSSADRWDGDDEDEDEEDEDDTPQPRKPGVPLIPDGTVSADEDEDEEDEV